LPESAAGVSSHTARTLLLVMQICIGYTVGAAVGSESAAAAPNLLGVLDVVSYSGGRVRGGHRFLHVLGRRGGAAKRGDLLRLRDEVGLAKEWYSGERLRAVAPDAARSVHLFMSALSLSFRYSSECSLSYRPAASLAGPVICASRHRAHSPIRTCPRQVVAPCCAACRSLRRVTGEV
jgi:hypothetical protein